MHRAGPPAQAGAGGRRRARSSRSRPASCACSCRSRLPGLGHVNTYALEDERRLHPRRPRPARRGVVEGAAWTRMAAAGIPMHRVHTRDRHPLAPRPLRRRRHAGRGERAPTSWPRAIFRTWWDPTDDGDEPELEARLEPLDPADDDEDGSPTAFGLPSPWGGDGGRLAGEERDGRARAPAPRDVQLVPRPRPDACTSTTPTASRLGRPRVGGRLHPGPHQRPPLPVRPRGRRAAVGRPRAAHDHAPHLRAHRGRPAARPTSTRSTGSPPSRASRTVLPAHGHPFTDLAGRVDAIKEHHAERLERLRAALARRGAGRRSTS